MAEDEYLEAIQNEIIHSANRCFNCNVCFTTCPLDKSLVNGYMTNGPSGIIQSIYYAIKWNLFDGKEREEILNLLYSCTTCSSCVITCKETSTGLPLLKIIEGGRQLLIEKAIGPLPSQRGILKSLQAKGNPYNQSPNDRLKWLGDMPVKRLPTQSAVNMYYVGCAASYDPELNKIAVNLVRLLNRLEIDFGILEQEKCCGCTAKRLGDEYLFADISEVNCNQFSQSGALNIFTTSPHCYSTFKNDYAGINELVTLHYSEFLYNQMKGKDLKFKNQPERIITYHDPCYLGKHNGIYEEPRQVLKAIPNIKLVEMKDNRANSLCCGGGGGRVWSEIDEEKRLANLRVEQAIGTGAEILAVACPWCFIMLQNGVKDLGVENRIRVMEITEVLLEALE